MTRGIELSNRDIFVHILQNRTPVMIEVTVVRSREDRDDRRELLRARLACHLVALLLDFVCSYDAQEVVTLEEVAYCFVSTFKFDPQSARVDTEEGGEKDARIEV